MEDIRKQRFLTIETKTESNLEEMQQKIEQLQQEKRRESRKVKAK